MEYSAGYMVMDVRTWTPLLDIDDHILIFRNKKEAEDAQKDLNYKTVLHEVSLVD